MFERARVKLAFAFAGTLFLALAVIGAAAYFAVRGSLDSDLNRSLAVAHASLLSTGTSVLAPAVTPVPTVVARGREEHDDDDEDDDEGRRAPASLLSVEVFYVVTDAGGSILANPREANVDGVDFAALSAAAAEGRTQSDVSASEHFRFVSSRLGSRGEVLHTGRSLASRDEQLRTLATVVAAGAVAAVAVAAASGWWLAGRALVPIQLAVETQRRFVSDASHELRTPLTVIQANTDLLMRHPAGTVEDNLEYVEAVSSATHQLASLVRDLLTLARADEGRLELSPSAVDLGEVVSDVVRDLGAVAAARGVRLEGDVVPAGVRADLQRMRQAVAILVDNAIKFTSPGGSVAVSVRPAGRHTEVAVSDTGPGISPEDLPRVFDRFYRADLARGGDGTGLGLAIARSLIEMHGGRLAVESARGSGTTFRLRVPLGGSGADEDAPGDRALAQ